VCGRYLLLALDPEAFARHYGLDGLAEPAVAPRYNIAPTQQVAVVKSAGDRRLAMMRWGLVAPWTKAPLINARSETAFDKPAFRSALRLRRCLIPASGFYEWKTTGKTKQPHLFQLRDKDLLAFAGIWDVEAAAIMTTAANDLVRPLHERMPVILPPDAYGRWLDPALQDAEALRPMLTAYPAEEMAVVPVGPRVNNARNEGPECIRPAV
jgi:putative SOS response-associated peptidase YedK